MPRIVECDSPTRSCTLQEATAAFQELSDPLGRQQFEAGRILLSLARDVRFLRDFLVTGLSNPASFQADNLNLNRSFILAKWDDWIIRTVLWYPAAPTVDALENRINVYDPLAHDHRFSFITTGLFGPGYLTENWIADPAATASVQEGDVIDLEYAGQSVLQHGEVLRYDAHVDVHRQAAPESLSISLNLVWRPDDFALRRQIYFDPTTSTIAHVVEGADGDVVSLCSLARTAFADALRAPLAELAATHPHAAVRAAALGQGG